MSRRSGSSARNAWLLAAVLCGLPGWTGATPGRALFDELPRTWRDDAGAEVHLAEFRGRPVVLTMAYTSCRRICPATLLRLQELQQQLDGRGEAAEFLIVGYDPAHDDPDAWRQYRSARHLDRPNWHFLTGRPADTESLARQLGFAFWRYDEHVMHPFRIVVFAASGEVQALIDSPSAARSAAW